MNNKKMHLYVTNLFLECITCHMSCVRCQVSHVTIRFPFSLLPSRVSENKRNFGYFIKICQIKFFEVQANSVKYILNVTLFLSKTVYFGKCCIF